jgi:hypothetical protein
VVADVAGVEGVHELEGPVVDGQAQDAHVVGVHHPVHEAHRLPLGEQAGRALGHLAQQRGVRVGGRAARGIEALDDVVGQGLQLGVLAAVAKCSKWPKRMKLGATRVTTAAVSIVSRRTGRSEPTTHSARVVGCPGLHGLADQELADRRAQHRAAVAHARVGRRPRP